MPLPLDTSVQATYEDGYVHDETTLNDISPYPAVDNEGNNIFADILLKRPEAEHGRLVLFSVFYKNHRYDIDWTTMPDNARPIRYRNVEVDIVDGQIVDKRYVKCGIGYQYKDENGKNIKEVKELE